MISYRGQVATAFEVLAEGLAPFIDSRMSKTFPDDDWILMAASKLGKRRDVLVSLSDPHFQLEVLNRWWGPAFSPDLSDEQRNTITALRTARNHWAHPDEDHPFDFDYAVRVHHDVEELLRAINSPEADRIAELAEQLRWDSVRDQARAKGMSQSDALMEQVTAMQKQYDELQSQLEEARDVAQSATGRQRAVARQLAELQSQYAAVSGLRDEYLAVQRQLEDERAHREAGRDDTTTVKEQLSRAEQVLLELHNESALLQQQLAETRQELQDVDPVETEAGRRWLWLVTALLLCLGLLIAVAAYIPTR
jgi:hypothetical protein